MKKLLLALLILGSTSATARTFGFGWACNAPNVKINGYPVFSRAYTREVAYGEIQNKCRLYYLNCKISCVALNF